jgi:DNA-binding winged helix-turn-helix (wHTH) protein
VTSSFPQAVVQFGVFQLDVQAGRLLKNGRVVRLKPQPFRLLQLLVSRAGEVVTREDIREVLWGSDTFVDFEQGVNSAIKQIREALNEDADRPLYLETVPKRGYRFTAPIDGPKNILPPARPTDLRLQKALWLNIAELKLAEQRREEGQRRLRTAIIAGSALVLTTVLLLLILW